MKSILIFLSTCTAVVVAAPVEDHPHKDTQILQRAKRSQYGPSYGIPAAQPYGISASYGAASPCASASAPIAAYAHASPYQLSIAPVHSSGYGHIGGISHHSAPYSGYGIAAPHYRNEDSFDEASEMMSFSDMDQGMMEQPQGLMEHPSARSAYSYDAASGYGGIGGIGAIGAIGGGAIGAAGPAYGVFPNANVGGCNVPLLLTCSPSIVPGKLVHGHHHYDEGSAIAVAPAIAAGHPNIYRGAGADENVAKKTSSKEESHSKEKLASHEKVSN